MDEFSFIDSIKQDSYRQSSLIKGVGDDAAVFRQSSEDIVVAVDTFVENVHFSKETMDLFHVGHRILAANISDIAAMGATPAFYLVSIVVPKHYTSMECKNIFKGMQSLATKYRMDLIGGDTVAGEEMSVSVTVLGYVTKTKARYRSAAVEGDLVFVTGTLGDSQAGFHILTNTGAYQDETYYVNKHRLPVPRVEFAHYINEIDRVALNDISDGIGNEAAEIAASSGVTIQLNEHKIPTTESFSQFPADLQFKWKLFGGEDFELVGTVSKNNWTFVQEAANKAGIDVTEIGYVRPYRHNHVYLHKDNRLFPLKKDGYNHFKQVKE
ncbi:thiamine-phosphate kinase [Virgibacillus phasianinus]|uniref:Thiamine-monophosphate kinase n=1 Tax=Virgibacillus phasianinus TaxID=2017483 RepID=A0A220U012_9BACI|nr:thiamine-phosphate kinase [Virgibacillus phasianinus]ASK61241.1 thiamine-phosphate kinase [Virgibacillus phasianinus]